MFRPFSFRSPFPLLSQIPDLCDMCQLTHPCATSQSSGTRLRVKDSVAKRTWEEEARELGRQMFGNKCDHAIYKEENQSDKKVEKAIRQTWRRCTSAMFIKTCVSAALSSQPFTNTSPGHTKLLMPMETGDTSLRTQPQRSLQALLQFETRRLEISKIRRVGNVMSPVPGL